MSGPLVTFILVLFIIIAILLGMIVHEIGHFVFAKIFKVSVKEFSIGVGPKIYSKEFKRTKFSFRPIILMAYVLIDSKKLNLMYKEFYDETKKERDEYLKISNPDNSVKKKIKKLENEMDKYKKLTYIGPNHLFIDDIKVWQKELIYFGGVFFNIITFIIFFLIQYYGLGYTDDPFKQLGDSFLIMFRNMVFYNAWGTDVNSGTVFGDIAQLSISGTTNYLTSDLVTLILVNYFCIFNLMIFIFNLIPIPPLDGFKIFIDGIASALKKPINKKLETTLTWIGISLVCYIFVTSVIADILY